MKEDIVLLATADWDNPFWTNKQHVALELSLRGHRVLYVESVGLRRPGVNRQDARRIVRRLRSGIRPPRKVRDNLWVWSPVLFPWHGISAVRPANRVLFSVLLHRITRTLNFGAPLLWTYNPITQRLINIDNFKAVVYHCVDESKARPGMPSSLIERSDASLTKSADVVFVTSRALEQRRRKWNTRVFNLGNVADYGHFSKAMSDELTVPEDMTDIQRPRIGFVGAINAHKLDLELLSYVAKSRPQWSLVMIGKVGEGAPNSDIEILRRHTNIILLGPKRYQDLPAYLKGLDVALLPNVINQYTTAMFPMKFFEYLAAGCPVVSTHLPALEEYADIMTRATSREEFLRGIEDALSDRVPSLEKRLAIAQTRTYQWRTDRMMELLKEAVPSLAL